MNKKNEVKVFTFNENNKPIRVEVVNGEPWFVGKDVCQALGFSKYRDVLSNLDEDERVSIFVDTLGGQQKMSAVNESGLYALIFQSRKPEAKKFRKWVTSEVLPSLRKTGRYELKPSGPVRRLLPRERGDEWEQFYSELTRCTTTDDEQTISELLHVTRKHVHEVATGRKQGYEVCRLLVECACDNRKKGVFRAEVVRDRLEEMYVLRGQLMFDFMGEED